MISSSNKVRLSIIFLLGLLASGIAGYSYYTFKVKEWKALEDLRSDKPLVRLEAGEYLVSVQSSAAIEYWKDLVISQAEEDEPKNSNLYDVWVLNFISQIEPEGVQAITELIHSKNKELFTWFLEEVEQSKIDPTIIIPELIKVFKYSKNLTKDEKFDNLLHEIVYLDCKNPLTFKLLLDLKNKNIDDLDQMFIHRYLKRMLEENISVSLQNIEEFLDSDVGDLQYAALDYLTTTDDFNFSSQASKKTLLRILQLINSNDYDIQIQTIAFLLKFSKESISHFDKEFSTSLKKIDLEEQLVLSEIYSHLGHQSKRTLLQNIFEDTSELKILKFDNFFEPNLNVPTNQYDPPFTHVPIKDPWDHNALFANFFPTFLSKNDPQIQETIFDILSNPNINHRHSYTFFKWLSYSKNHSIRSAGIRLLKRFNQEYPGIRKVIVERQNYPLQLLKDIEQKYRSSKKFNDKIVDLITSTLETNQYLEKPKEPVLKFLNKLTIIHDPKFQPTLNQCLNWIKETHLYFQGPPKSNTFIVRLFEVCDNRLPDELIQLVLDSYDIELHSRIDLLLSLGYESPKTIDYLNQLRESIRTDKHAFNFAYWWIKKGQIPALEKEQMVKQLIKSYLFIITDQAQHYPKPEDQKPKLSFAKEIIHIFELMSSPSIVERRSYRYLLAFESLSDLLISFGVEIEDFIHESLNKQSEPNELTTIYLRFLLHYNCLKPEELQKIADLIDSEEISLSFVFEILKSHKSLGLSTSTVKGELLKILKNYSSSLQHLIIDQSSKILKDKTFIYPHLRQLLKSNETDLQMLAIQHLTQSKTDHPEIVRMMEQILRVQILAPGNQSGFNYPQSFLDHLAPYKENAHSCAELIWQHLKNTDVLKFGDDELTLLDTLIKMGTHNSQATQLLIHLMNQSNGISHEDLYYFISEFPTPPNELLPTILTKVKKISKYPNAARYQYLFDILELYGHQAKDALPHLELIYREQTSYFYIEQMMNTMNLIKNSIAQYKSKR